MMNIFNGVKIHHPAFTSLDKCQGFYSLAFSRLNVSGDTPI